MKEPRQGVSKRGRNTNVHKKKEQPSGHPFSTITLLTTIS
jgi:hypothetical protein